MTNDGRLDGLFMTAVQQSQGIDNFFDNLFGFMNRKTDFLTQEGKAYEMVNKYLNKHITAHKQQREVQAAIEKKKAEMKAKEQAEREKAAKEKAD